MSLGRRIWQKVWQYTRSLNYIDLIVVVSGILLALLLRITLRSFRSNDAEIITGWYRDIQAKGFPALKDGVANYPPLYLYVLYLISVVFPGMWEILAIKLPSIIVDFICAWFVFRIVKLKYPAGPIPLFAFLAILFAPTIVLNGSFWGQIDILYVAALVACFYFILKEKPWAGCLAFGIAFAIKAQSIFLGPFLLILLLKRKIPWPALLIIPAVYLLLVIPVWISGGSFLDLMSIYLSQANQYNHLTSAAPNLYTWIPNSFYDYFLPAGILFGVSVSLFYVLTAYKSRVLLTPRLMIQLALGSLLLVPFFLPKMHDRYFFPADVLSILYGFYLPEYFFIPVLVNLTSFFAYQHFLFNMDTIPSGILAVVLFGVIVFVIHKTLLCLYPPVRKSANETPEDHDPPQDPLQPA